jgi:MFS family permease
MKLNVHTSPAAETVARGRVAWRPWIIAGLLSLFMFINFADKAIIGIAAVPMMREMRLSPTQWGVVGSSFFALFAVAAMLVGFAVGRVPAKWALAALGLVWALTQFPMIASVSFPVLIACRVALGAGEGPAYPVALHAVYKWFPNDQRTLPTSLIAIGSAVGVFTIAPILAYLIDRFSWHAAFGFLGALGLAWVVAWIVFGAEGTNDAAATAVSTGPRISLGRLLISPTVIGILATGLAVYWALALLVVWTPAFLQEGLGYGVVATTTLVSLTWGGVAVLMPLIGWLSQRAKLAGRSSRATRALPAGLLAMGSGTLSIIALVLPPGVAQIALLALAYSIGGAIFSLGPAIIGELTQPDQRGALLGITSALNSLAGLMAPVVTGRIIAGAAVAHDGYIAAYILSGTIVAAGGLAGMLLIRPEVDRARFAAMLIARQKLAGR